jgi:hypothetical protein
MGQRNHRRIAWGDQDILVGQIREPGGEESILNPIHIPDIACRQRPDIRRTDAHNGIFLRKPDAQSLIAPEGDAFLNPSGLLVREAPYPRVFAYHEFECAL